MGAKDKKNRMSVKYYPVLKNLSRVAQKIGLSAKSRNLFKSKNFKYETPKVKKVGRLEK